jgi:hypothetical protein
VTSSGHAKLGRGILAAGLLAMSALMLWLVAISASWVSGCPRGAAASPGADAGASAWPPGAECLAQGPGGDTYVHEALPWIEVAIVGLLVASAIVLVAGIFGAIQGLRLRGERIRVADHLHY